MGHDEFDIYTSESHQIVLQHGLLVEIIPIDWEEVRFFEQCEDEFHPKPLQDLKAKGSSGSLFLMNGVFERQLNNLERNPAVIQRNHDQRRANDWQDYFIYNVAHVMLRKSKELHLPVMKDVALGVLGTPCYKGFKNGLRDATYGTSVYGGVERVNKFLAIQEHNRQHGQA